MSLTKATYSMINGAPANVRDFGAKGDGVTDDTAAIQAALDTGHGVYIPDGDYKITSTLTMDTAGQKLSFQSRAAKIITATDITAISLNKSFIEIESGTIQGAASTGTASTSAGIKFYDCQRGRIVFTYIWNFGYGISMDGAVSNWVNRIDSCYIYLNKRAGIYKCGHATTITGGEISGSVYGVLQADLQAGAALAINRDSALTFGQCVQVTGCTIEGIGTGQVRSVTNAANNGSGLIRLSAVLHGYSTGDIIAVNDIGGTIEANGVWPINVIDANTIDLKASTFINAFSSGGTVRRGVGVYSGIGNTGVMVSDCYFESVPVAIQYGDAYFNNGTTAHSTLVFGANVKGCYLLNNNTNGCLVAVSRLSNSIVMSNSGFMAGGYGNTLLNSINDNYASSVANLNNYGFTSQYAAAGSQVIGGLTISPSSKNPGVVLDIRVPATAGSSSSATALRVTNYGGTPNVQVFDPIMLLAGAQLGIGGPTIKKGAGTPEGIEVAGVGSLFLRTDGGASTTLYVKQSGTGNTGWVGK